MTVLIFQVADHFCALPTARINELLLLAALDRRAGMPPAVEGFLNLSGKFIPVVRMDRLLRVPDIELRLSTPLILLKGEPAVALLAEKITGVRIVSRADLKEVPEAQSFRDGAQAVFPHEDGTAALLSDRIEELAFGQEAAA